MTEGPYKLPEGWRWVRLGEVAQIINGRTLRKGEYVDYNTGLKILKFRDITADGKIIWTNDKDGYVCCDANSIEALIGDVLITSAAHSPEQIGKKVGYLAEIPTHVRKVFFTAELLAIRCIREMSDGRWIYLWLRSDKGFEQVQGQVKEKHLVKSRASEILIPLPPLPEQRRIVARIEELMERVREAKRLRRQAKEDAERLWQSALAETFPRPGSELPPGWRWVRLGEVCETKMGGTPSTKDTEYWEPPEIVWVTPEDLEKCELNRVFSSRRLISRAGLEKSSAKLFPHKTVLLSTTATIGKVGVAEKPLSANQQISGIICGDTVNPEFLAYYLLRLGETGLKQLGGTATATHINQTNLRSLPIPLPPLDEQQHIVTYLGAVQEKIRALKFAQTETDEELKHLEQAILDKAFQGEL